MSREHLLKIQEAKLGRRTEKIKKIQELENEKYNLTLETGQSCPMYKTARAGKIKKHQQHL